MKQFFVYFCEFCRYPFESKTRITQTNLKACTHCDNINWEVPVIYGMKFEYPEVKKCD